MALVLYLNQYIPCRIKIIQLAGEFASGVGSIVFTYIFAYALNFENIVGKTNHYDGKP